MDNFISRRAWGARAPRGTYTPVASTKGVKVHYTGGRVEPAIVDDHDLCVAVVKSIQKHHMDGNGWMDIAYSMIACPHRKVFEGRGPKRLTAANGEGRNRDHYAVLGLVGSSGLVTPNDELLHGILDAIAYLRREGSAGNEIKGHRNGFSTECPGDALDAWIRRGAPRPPTSTPTPPSKGEPMPEIVSLGLSAEVTVPSSVNHQPWWTTEWRDTAGWHPAGAQSIAPDVDVWADVAAHIALRGLAPGETVELGLTRHAADGTLLDVAWPIGRLMSVQADLNGRVQHDIGGHFKLSATQRGRVTIRHTSTGPVTLETPSAFKAILHRTR
ncbi:peptidoglycan recognition protein family protein [Sinosporangium siamense]|uniref:Peptidoglycan recognition protein family domain-containing protein n=1 Tax=Sinosporangium siamense TaxID=1367973 RepID=A0A919V5K9_9ACTN|nr:peptidoglycan recognition family protein [Sinosporangium siamense]GII90032.1 hypothetical protein Ssi02_02630 [Sinosporangium siamense]